mmetsp:Transcript_8214/g.17497  ORF Transcript_8214/g.17497 Transcript_8214/m.17497 type:complete len:256 (+) Transcript_8214:1051-1818(+)
MFRLDQRRIHGFDHRRFVGHRAKLVIEHGKADDIQGDRAEFLFHLDGSSRLSLRSVVLGRRLFEGGNQPLVAIAEQPDHVVQPRFVEGRDDGPTTHRPRLWIRRNEPLAHDGLQNLRQDSLVVEGVGIPQDVLGLDGVRDDQEALGPEAEFVGAAVGLLVALQADEHGAVGDVGDFSLGEGTLVEGGEAAVDLLDVRAEDVGGVGEGDVSAGRGGGQLGELPNVFPPPRQTFRRRVGFPGRSRCHWRRRFIVACG